MRRWWPTEGPDRATIPSLRDRGAEVWHLAADSGARHVRDIATLPTEAEVVRVLGLQLVARYPDGALFRRA